LAETDPRIIEDSREVFGRYLKKYGFLGPIIDLLPIKFYEQTGEHPDFFQYFSNRNAGMRV